MNKEFTAIAVIENLPNVVYVKDAKNFRYVYVNKAFETDLKVIKENVTVQTYDDEIITVKGPRIFSTRKLPMASTTGEIEYIIGISEDITEKRLAERQSDLLVFERGARAEAEKVTAQLKFLSQVSTSISESLDLNSILKSVATITNQFYSDWFVVDLFGHKDLDVERVIVASTDSNGVNVVKPGSEKWKMTSLAK